MRPVAARTPKHAAAHWLLPLWLISGVAAGQAVRAGIRESGAAPAVQDVRMLLVFAPSAQDRRFRDQAAILNENARSLRAHDVARYTLFANGVGQRNGVAISTRATDALRRRYHVLRGDFKLIFVDGGRTVIQSDREVGAGRLSAVIGNLAIRRRTGADGEDSSNADKASGQSLANKKLPLQPSKLLTPAQVVRIQMEALQHNDVPRPDSGIATTFAFASPENRQTTGPLEHFAQIVKAPAYLPMLNCKRVTYDTIVVEGEKAQQRVHIVAADGSHITYIFMLSRQADGVYAGCWMNDGCIRDNSDTQDHRFDA